MHILEHMPHTLEWVSTGEGNESEGGRRKYTKKGHTKPDGDNKLLTECN